MNDPFRRLRTGLLILAAIFVIATWGYHLFGWTWLDSFYMVVITLSTVGYGEVGVMTPSLKIFTVLVIVFGGSTALYIAGGFVQMVLEGEINRAFGHRRVTKEIERMEGHVILCGFGRMGEVVAGELTRRKQPFVVVDEEPARINEALGLGYLAIQSNASDEETLLRAGIALAKTLVITLPSDADNVFITLTARNLNPALTIIARGELRSTEKKLIQAGADRVIFPATTAALRIAAMITRPSTLELIELASAGHNAEMAIDEFTIPPDSPLVGSTVRDSGTRSRHGLLIVAIRGADGQLAFNPDASSEFRPGDAVIAMGRVEDIERFRADYGIR
ncbi:MAG: potassium channel family protein [Thermoguttaceae bacterium]